MREVEYNSGHVCKTAHPRGFCIWRIQNSKLKRQPENNASTSSREGGSTSEEASERMGEWRGRGRGRGRGTGRRISAAAALAVVWVVVVVVVVGGGGCDAHDPGGSARSTALGATRSIRSCSCALAPTRKVQGGGAGGGGSALLLLRCCGVYFGGADGERLLREGLRGGGGQGLVPDPSWSDEIEEEGLVKVDAEEQVRGVCFPEDFQCF